MSRAYKNSVADTADDLSSGTLVAAGVEKLSGADLEQLMLAAANGSNPAVNAAGDKTVGTNTLYAGRSNAALSGADLESSAGSQ